MRTTLAIICSLFTTGILSAASDVVTSLEDALDLDAARCRDFRPFDFTATALNDAGGFCYFTDRNVGSCIENHAGPHATWTAGDRVRITGKMHVSPDEHPYFFGTNFTVVGHAPLPPPFEITDGFPADERMTYRTVRVRGVVTSVVDDEFDDRYNWMLLSTRAQRFRIPVKKSIFTACELRALLDGEVEITGLYTPTSDRRRHLGHQLILSCKKDLKVIRAPPTAPFATPTLKDDRILHRQKTEGTVVAISRNRFFLRSRTGRLVSVSPAPGETVPAVGSSVIASGFAEYDPYHIRLYEALTRPGTARQADDAQPEPLPMSALYAPRNPPSQLRKPGRDYHGMLVRVSGTILRRLHLPDDSLALLVGDGPHAVRVDLPPMLEQSLPPMPDGSDVEVTGLCLATYSNPDANRIFPRLETFSLVPRTASDFRIISTPPWWTPFRLLVLVLVLTAAIAAILIWNVALKRKSERRGKELYEERLSHALAEQKVEERTRLAVELHDSISQSLTGVALQLDGGETETAKSMLSACRGELRRCLWDLRSRTFEEKDMTEAVTRTIAPHLNGCAATVRFNVPRDRLSESVTHAILRIVRELVVNAIRHGQAKHVKVAGEFHDDTISFSVKDDGVGFDPGTAPGPEQGHFGLLGIRERLEDFDGELTVESAPGQGARFAVTLNTRKKDDGK